MDLNTIIVLLSLLFFGLFIRFYLPSYFQEKAKNLATKEDIGAITREVEDVKHSFKEFYDLTKSEKEFYSQMIKIMQKFLTQIKRQELQTGTQTTKQIIESDPLLSDGYHEFVDHTNEILTQAFVFLGEESYERLRSSLKEQTNFAELRTNLLDAMRKSVYPETTHKASKDTWEIKY